MEKSSPSFLEKLFRRKLKKNLQIKMKILLIKTQCWLKDLCCKLVFREKIDLVALIIPIQDISIVKRLYWAEIRLISQIYYCCLKLIVQMLPLMKLLWKNMMNLLILGKFINTLCGFYDLYLQFWNIFYIFGFFR